MDKPTSLDPSELTKEQSLAALYRLSWRFPVSRFNVALTFAAGIVMAIYCFYSGVSIGGLAATVRKLADTGLAASTSLLGFLIAGFTVFATVTKVELFVEMARVEHEKSRESYLKYNLSAFVVVFVHYVAYLFVCMSIVVMGQSGGPVSFAIKTLAVQWPRAVEPEIIFAVCGILLVLFATWTFYLILLLKSFVFNTYQVLVTVVRWEMEGQGPPSDGPP